MAEVIGSLGRFRARLEGTGLRFLLGVTWLRDRLARSRSRPVEGRTLGRILKDNGIQVLVVETNLQVVQDLRARGELAIYGDASLREVLLHAGIEKADGLIIAASNAPADTIIRAF